jgi:GntR family transcriptional regulator, transcriptional repressor for pyruvate dehydrogenase complex
MSKLIRSKIALRRPASLAVQLADELRKRLESGELKPGDRLPSELELMEAYGVSRTVVREAISSLKAENLVSTQQGVGAFVERSSPSVSFRISHEDLDAIKELIDLLELRISIEAETAALAAERRSEQQLQSIRDSLDELTRCIRASQDHVESDFRFHMEIAHASGNHYFSDLFGYLGPRLIPRSNIKSFAEDSVMRDAYLQRVNREHEDIFEAILRQDPEAARSAMRVHLVNSRERLRFAYEQADGAES